MSLSPIGSKILQHMIMSFKITAHHETKLQKIHLKTTGNFTKHIPNAHWNTSSFYMHSINPELRNHIMCLTLHTPQVSDYRHQF